MRPRAENLGRGASREPVTGESAEAAPTRHRPDNTTRQHDSGSGRVASVQRANPRPGGGRGRPTADVPPNGGEPTPKGLRMGADDDDSRRRRARGAKGTKRGPQPTEGKRGERGCERREKGEASKANRARRRATARERRREQRRPEGAPSDEHKGSDPASAVKHCAVVLLTLVD